MRAMMIRPVGPKYLEEFGWVWLWPVWVIAEVLVSCLKPIISTFWVDRIRYILIVLLLPFYLVAVEYISYKFYTGSRYIYFSHPALWLVLAASVIIGYSGVIKLKIIRFYKVLVQNNRYKTRWITVARPSLPVTAPNTLWAFSYPIVIYELVLLITVVSGVIK